MAADRSGFLYTAANSMAATGNAFLFGVSLDGKTADASLSIYNVSSSLAPNWTDRVLVVTTGRSTGSKDVMFPVPVYLSSGLYVSLSAKSTGSVFFTKKT